MISGYIFSSHTSFDKSMKIGEISLSDKFEIKIREDPNIRIAAPLLIMLATSAPRTCTCIVPETMKAGYDKMCVRGLNPDIAQVSKNMVPWVRGVVHYVFDGI